MATLKTDLKAEDIMVTEPVCVDPSTTLLELTRVFDENEISGAPVIDSRGSLIGIVSKTDLIRQCAEGTLDVPPAYLFEVLSEQGGADMDIASASSICVEDFMTPEPTTVTPDTPVGKIARMMHEGRMHRVIVIDGESYPIGIITALDILGVFPA